MPIVRLSIVVGALLAAALLPDLASAAPPGESRCVPVERLRGHPQADFDLWRDRCSTLAASKCASTTEWPDGSGGRCASTSGPQCVPVSRIRSTPDAGLWTSRCASLPSVSCASGDEWPKGSGGRCEQKRCVPTARIRANEQPDVALWQDRCSSLGESQCASTTEWPTGSGGRCEVSTGPQCIPVERLRQSPDAGLWAVRCASLPGPLCASSTEWPAGSGARCEISR